MRARRERRRSEGDAGESAGLDSGESVSGDFATAADFPREPAEVEDTGILRALGRRDAPAVLGRLASLWLVAAVEKTAETAVDGTAVVEDPGADGAGVAGTAAAGVTGAARTGAAWTTGLEDDEATGAEDNRPAVADSDSTASLSSAGSGDATLTQGRSVRFMMPR